MKKPIYLYVLVTLSSISVLLGLYNVFTMKPYTIDKSLAQAQGMSEELLSQVQKVSDASILFQTNALNKLFSLVFVTLIITTIFFLVKKNIKLANYTYMGYLGLTLVHTIYGYIGSQSAFKFYTDSQFLAGVQFTSKIAVAINIVIFLIFFGIVLYKTLQQNKATEAVSSAGQDI